MSKTLIEKITEEHNVIMLCRFGSHLYGTDTPESDTDYKGIFMPTKEQILLNKIPKTLNYDSNPSNEKNTEEDIDCELYSFHYFMLLACKGEMIALDMLHANKENILFSNDIWDQIQARRGLFYTTEMRAFVGYAKKQAALYGMKGSRLKSAEKLIEFLSALDQESRMSDVWKELPTDENMKHMQYEGGCAMKYMMFNFCGKQIQSTNKVKYTLDMVQKFYDSYGHRAIAAKKNEGVDWKAMSHAMRAGLQIKEIFQTGDLKFPLKEASFLRRVKQGKLSFDLVIGNIECILDEIEQLSIKSTLPIKVDRTLIDEFIMTNTRVAVM